MTHTNDAHNRLLSPRTNWTGEPADHTHHGSQQGRLGTGGWGRGGQLERAAARVWATRGMYGPGSSALGAGIAPFRAVRGGVCGRER